MVHKVSLIYRMSYRTVRDTHEEKKLFILFDVCKWFAYMCGCAPYTAWYLRTDKGTGFPGTGIADSYEWQWGCWESNSCPLGDQPVILSALHSRIHFSEQGKVLRYQLSTSRNLILPFNIYLLTKLKINFFLSAIPLPAFSTALRVFIIAFSPTEDQDSILNLIISHSHFSCYRTLFFSFVPPGAESSIP